MTRPTDPTALDSVVKLVAEHGTDAIAAAFGRLPSIAMEARGDAAIWPPIMNAARIAGAVATG